MGVSGSDHVMDVCASLQARFLLIKLDSDEEEEEDLGQLRVNRGIPPNGPTKVLIRVYVVSVSPTVYAVMLSLLCCL